MASKSKSGRSRRFGLGALVGAVGGGAVAGAVTAYFIWGRSSAPASTAQIPASTGTPTSAGGQTFINKSMYPSSIGFGEHAQRHRAAHR